MEQKEAQGRFSRKNVPVFSGAYRRNTSFK